MFDNVNTANICSSEPTTTGPSSSSSEAALTSLAIPQTGVSIPKRKRRPAGTPDPDAAVVSLSPKTLLESDRYVCEFCNQGFQREQNLQMHRRRHKVPWKASKRATTVETPLTTTSKKRVYVCPEPSCVHHDARHALGDLVGIKKHYRRKHSNRKHWICDRCSKGYAVQSDYKAHLKTCGTRAHSCDCGRVFSRVESFIEHQDACTAKGNSGTDTKPLQQPMPICSSTTSPSSDTNFNSDNQLYNCLELQLLPSSSIPYPPPEDHTTTGLKLSIGLCSTDQKTKQEVAGRLDEELKLAMAEKSYADEKRQEARRQTELAELEFASAKRIRQAAKAELEKAELLKEQAIKKISAIMLEITCHACKQKFLE